MRRVADGDRDGWLLGHGWATDRWAAHPSAPDLERVAPGRRIALWSHDHHTMWLSMAALAAAGLTASTPEPVGGVVVRDASGRPDGLLHEHAIGLVDDVLPRPTTVAIEDAVIRYARRLAAVGVTGVHDPGSLAADTTLAGGFGATKAMAEGGRLQLRVHAGIRSGQLEAAIDARLRSGQRVELGRDTGPSERRAIDRFRVGWLKLFADGSLGSRTAAMFEPYDDASTRPGPGGPHGGLLDPPEVLREQVERAADAGLATMIHAIGDEAVGTVLDFFEAVDAWRLAVPTLMPRIEHAQLVRPVDRARFARLGVAASVQPIQLRSDLETMRHAIGSRASLAFPLASLASAGALLALGTDAPVEPPDPWPGLAMATTRWAPEWGTDIPPHQPSEGLGLAAALRAATIGPRRSAGEPLAGRLVVGEAADLVVVALGDHQDPAGAAEAVRTIAPLLTMLDGEERYRAPGFDR
ncbi:MAG TPA: amidohydrolase family protein [Candidatus Saccharimonadia bacterium]|nr:amidohydrolase family protein [Candidatus Saccharimonadia bacterium]